MPQELRQDSLYGPCTRSRLSRALAHIMYIERFIALVGHGMNDSSCRMKTVSNSCPLTDFLFRIVASGPSSEGMGS